MTELQAFVAMLERAGIGHGSRVDHNPPGTAILVEHEEGDYRDTITEWAFDGDGRLKEVLAYESEVG